MSRIDWSRIFFLMLNPFAAIKVLICKVRSFYYSRYIYQGTGKIIISDPWLSVKITKSKGARIIVNGNFRIASHLGGTIPVRIILGQNATLCVDGDFIIGQGVRLFINDNANLYIGGKRHESDSGITADSLIMVYQRIHIGYDFICAWNVFISDSDWHQIMDKQHHADIEIGDHVWIANNCSILKGTNIGSNSVVASHSKIINKKFPANSMLAGIPGKIVEADISWNRDLKFN
jgi:acetyltransferase-like isoleucine patch superfamily enzyme